MTNFPSADENFQDAAYKLLADHMDDIVSVHDIEGRFLYVSPSFERKTGIPTEEVLGKDAYEGIHPDDRTRVLANMHQPSLAGDTASMASIEWRRLRRDGTYLWMESRVAIVKDSLGIPYRIICTSRDISQRKAIEEERERLQQEILEATLKQRRFLREMLFSLTGGKLLLLDSQEQIPAAPTAPPAAATTVQLESPTALKRFRQHVLAAAHTAGLSSERTNDLLSAVGEASMNAVVHGGGGEARIYADPEAGQVQVVVQDSGTGIPEDSLHRATLERGYSSMGTLGHGFYLILQTCDRAYLLTGKNGTTLVVEQGRYGADPSWLREALSAA
jgi:PAS domain S-box-containing protein